MSDNNEIYFCPTSRKDWRDWLEQNHHTHQSIWVVFFKVSSGVPSITWSEAVDEALCFGWIDSTKKTVDENRYKQFFSKRNAKSNWSKINKEKIETLTSQGLMTKAGFDSVEVAKQNGSWTILDAVEALIIPADLEEALNNQEAAKSYFLSLSKSKRKSLLYWVISAKRTETREKRITEVVLHSAQQQMPKQFR
tara:strand:- start:5994 stop:6575 length:582 start_codon:yes stop_codon:yes gene_type:complete